MIVSKKVNINDVLGLLHSDKLILEILSASNEYLEQNPNVKDSIEENNWTLRSLFELVPETLENFWSGHVFPIAEAEYELECSIALCKLGFYKHAIVSMRNVLELGLLSVYWDVDDKSHIDIQGWFRSMESTPFRKKVFSKLRTNKNIKEFDEKKQLFKRTAALYGKLSDFSHTKGFKYSSRMLNRHHSNVNNFNEPSLKKWLSLMREVVEVVTIFHILKYPVGLQHTPMEEKFGLNPPAGGLLRPVQVERIKKLISKDLLETLQKISDSDRDAAGVVEWINGLPDITEGEFNIQIEKQDKTWIEMQGFENWFKNEKKLYKKLLEKKHPEEYKKKLEYFKKLRAWAKKENLLIHPKKYE